MIFPLGNNQTTHLGVYLDASGGPKIAEQGIHTFFKIRCVNQLDAKDTKEMGGLRD